MNINLDKLFRKDSGAREIAEMLLSGKAYTRQQLVAGTNLSVTSVNRVVQVLEESGAKFSRELAEDGRQARFRLLSIGEPKSHKLYPTIQDEAQVVRAEFMSGTMMLDIVVGKSRFRGVLQSLSKSAPVGKIGRVMGVELDSTGAAIVKVDVKGDKPFTLANLHSVDE